MATFMDLKTMPKETAAEVLQFLSENEEFRSVAETVGEDLAVEEVRALLRELAMELRRDAAVSPRSAYDVTKCRHLTGVAKQIISCLSPMEEKTMLSAFGLIDQAVVPAAVASIRSERK